MLGNSWTVHQSLSCNNQGLTSLFCSHEECVELLLKHGAKVDVEARMCWPGPHSNNCEERGKYCKYFGFNEVLNVFIYFLIALHTECTTQFCLKLKIVLYVSIICVTCNNYICQFCLCSRDRYFKCFYLFYFLLSILPNIVIDGLRAITSNVEKKFSQPVIVANLCECGYTLPVLTPKTFVSIYGLRYTADSCIN